MNFIGRTKELKKLDVYLSRDLMSIGIIYGRRRIGKSELIKKALKVNNVTSIYYECKEVAPLSNVTSLSLVLSETLNLPKLGYSDIESLLEYFFVLAKDKNLILVLDEFPYLIKTIPGINSIIQSLIDKYRYESKLKLVLLGSYIDIMKSLLITSNPLYGRIDFEINLKELSYYEAQNFYPNFSLEDKVRLYSVFGGIPYYNKLIDVNKSVKENIINLITSPGARLENEIPLYLNAEISKITNANEVFIALSKGINKYKDILSKSHVSSGPTLIDILNKLISMDVISKVEPINEEGNKKKLGYFIKDNLTLFYYRYLFRYSSQLQIMDPEVFYEKYIENDFETSFVPNRFEIICKQFIIKENLLNHFEPPLFKIGKYYYDDPLTKSNGEFDLVSEDENGYIFYEVKFRKQKLSSSLIKEEIEQVKSTKLKVYKYAFFSRSGYENTNFNDVTFYTLEDLYK